jgi:hypothetical protein
LGVRVMGLLGVVSVGFCFTASRAQAEPVVHEARIESARGVALGSGMRANAAASQAIADNPANLPQGGLAHLETFFGYQPTIKRMGVGGAVVDSMTSRLAAGLSARGLFGDNDAGDNSGWEGRAALGLPIIDLLSVGIAGRYSNFTVSDPKARPEHAPQEGMPPDRTFKLKGFTMDAAATLHLLRGLSISGLGYNLIDTGSPLAPMMVGGGLAFTAGAISLGGDALVDLNKHKLFSGPKLTVGGGLEYLAQSVAPLRVGYQYDNGRHQHAITAGVGYVDQRFGAQLSLRQVLGDAKETTLFSAVQYFISQ